MTSSASVCADGSASPPGLIFTGADNTIQASWVEDVDPGKHSVFVTVMPSGWTNNDVGVAWLEQLFNRYTKKKARRAWRLLNIDGHGSRVQSLAVAVSAFCTPLSFSSHADPCFAYSRPYAIRSSSVGHMPASQESRRLSSGQARQPLSKATRRSGN